MKPLRRSSLRFLFSLGCLATCSVLHAADPQPHFTGGLGASLGTLSCADASSHVFTTFGTSDGATVLNAAGLLAVAEPGAWALAGAGLLALLVISRRRNS